MEKMSCSDLPESNEGEAAFAASNSNIAIIGEETWIANGGKSSRILYSPNKGKTWQALNTPIAQGLPTTGMYSIDFYDALNGFAIGGDYSMPEDNKDNKIITNVVSLDILIENGLVGKNDLVKILGNGELKSPLKISVHKFTASAKAAIEAAGGEAISL